MSYIALRHLDASSLSFERLLFIHDAFKVQPTTLAALSRSRSGQKLLQMELRSVKRTAPC
jgi:hypothetical protein